MVVLLCLDCYNRKPKIVWLIYNANLFFTVLEAKVQEQDTGIRSAQ